MSTQTPAQDWAAPHSRQIAVHGIELRGGEHGDGPLVVFCRGLPELGFSWR